MASWRSGCNHIVLNAVDFGQQRAAGPSDQNNPSHPAHAGFSLCSQGLTRLGQCRESNNWICSLQFICHAFVVSSEKMAFVGIPPLLSQRQRQVKIPKRCRWISKRDGSFPGVSRPIGSPSETMLSMELLR